MATPTHPRSTRWLRRRGSTSNGYEPSGPVDGCSASTSSTGWPSPSRRCIWRSCCPCCAGRRSARCCASACRRGCRACPGWRAVSLPTLARLRLTASSQELGEAEEVLPGDFAGEELTIGFNSRYILDALGPMEGDRVAVELKDALSPGVFRSAADEDHLCVIMPMRI